MKHLKLTLLALTIIFTSACKNDIKEEKKSNEKEEVSEVMFVVKPEGTSVKWTAYKTTEKKPVNGEFAILNFDAKKGATPQDALNNLEFSIPVNSLFTKDEVRDSKLKASFFGAMLNTELISGKIKVTDNKYVASITMNGATNDLPLDVSILEERRVKMNGVLNLKDWNALDALTSLNKVCFDLHKGPDGVSKTWENVAIEINTYLREK